MQQRKFNKYSDFLKASGLLFITTKDDEPEAEFVWSGCECCDNGLGNSLYECQGMTNKNEVIDGIMLCADCISYFVNGE